MIKVGWDVEELVALIDVYLRCGDKNKECVDAELKALSQALNIRADRLGIKHDEKFRNINGMLIMYQNVVYTATGGEQGMSHASSAMQTVYRMSISAPDAFALILKEFKDRYGLAQ